VKARARRWVVQVKAPMRGRRGGGYAWGAVSQHRSREAAERAARKVRFPAAAHSAVRVVEVCS